MSDWSGPLSRLLGGLDDLASVLWLEAKLRHGWLDPVAVLPYRGHGTVDRWHLLGRVLEEPGIARARPEDPFWRNLVAVGRRFASAEVPGAVVGGHHAGRRTEAVADVEGFFRFELPGTGATGWQTVELDLVGPLARGQDGVRAVGEVLVPRASADFGVISDLDDTVIRSGVTDVVTMLSVVFLHNAWTRLPFPGVRAFYRALEAGPDGAASNPVFYVSGSPWNLYDLLEEFLDVQAIPKGPMILKDWGIGEGKWWRQDTGTYKLDRIARLLDLYPDLDFVLIGDSGQHDPEIYREVARHHPGRVKAVYIRDVTTPQRHAEVMAVAGDLRRIGVPLVLSDTTYAAAEHAAAAGLIDAAALPAIGAEKERDERP